MHALRSTFQQMAQDTASRTAKPRLGIVTSYDPNYHTAKVKLQPDQIQTGWLPIMTAWIGNGWGLVCPPSVGDQVEVEFQESVVEAGYVCGRIFSTYARPPVDASGNGCPSGDFWLVHQTGSLLKFHGDGSVELTSNGNLNVTVGGNLTATVTGTASIYAAAINLGKQAMDALKTLCTITFQQTYNGHTHTTPSGTSGVPIQQSTSADMTSILKAE